MSDTNAQAFNIKAYVNNLLSEKRELETANTALEAERSKLKQGILKYGEIAKNLEAQNKELQSKILMMQRHIDTLQQENTKLAATAANAASASVAIAPASDYSSEIAETLLFAQRTAKQLVAEAEQKADVLNQDTKKALTTMYTSVSQVRELIRRIGDDINLVESSLSTIKPE